MLHHIAFVAVLDGLGDQAAFNIPPVDEIILKVSVSPGDHRFSDKAGNPHPFPLLAYAKQAARDLPAVYGINNVL